MTRRRDKQIADLRAQLGYEPRLVGAELSRRDLVAGESVPAWAAIPLSGAAAPLPGPAVGNETPGAWPRGAAGSPLAGGNTAPAVTPVAAAVLVTPLLVVSGVHSWAGTSTVAVAVGGAAAGRGLSACVEEFAGPSTSGLVVACDAELGTDESGDWRIGRRRGLTLRRLASDDADLATARAPLGPTVDVVVADTGCPWPAVSSQVFAAPSLSPLTAVVAATPLILVCRATVPSLRRAEAVIDALADNTFATRPPALAVLGPTRWPSEVTASLGSRVAWLWQQGRVVTVPLDKQLAVRGVTADPLPKSVAAAGRSLLQLFTSTPARTTTKELSR